MKKNIYSMILNEDIGPRQTGIPKIGKSKRAEQEAKRAEKKSNNVLSEEGFGILSKEGERQKHKMKRTIELKAGNLLKDVVAEKAFLEALFRSPSSIKSLAEDAIVYNVKYKIGRK